jgi:3-hydroxybutyryl-CoA dehydrogenase
MEVKTIGIVGAGAKARDIAYLALTGGFGVVLEDVSETRLADSVANIRRALARAPDRGHIHPRLRDDAIARLSTMQSVEDAARQVDLLIEAAPDDAELQLEIFTIFDKFAKPGTILASTANSVAIDELAAMTNRPQQCVGLRFPDRAAETKLLDVVCALETSESTVRACLEFGRRMGMEPRALSESANAVASAREAHLR